MHFLRNMIAIIESDNHMEGDAYWWIGNDQTLSKLSESHSNIERREALFALKLTSKYMLTREAVADILTFCEDIHVSKTELIGEKLTQNFSSPNNIDIQKVTSAIHQYDNVIGLKDQMLTEHKRDKYLKTHFEFLEPVKVLIVGENNQTSFYYRLPVVKTLNRLLQDKSLRKYLIHQPLFTNVIAI